MYYCRVAVDLSCTICDEGVEGKENGEKIGTVPRAAMTLAEEYVRLHRDADDGEVNNVVFIGLLEGIGMSNEYLANTYESYDEED